MWLKLSEKVGSTTIQFYNITYWNKYKKDITWEWMTEETQISAVPWVAMDKL